MQIVNLYTQEFRPVKTVLPLAQIVLVTVALIILLAAASVWMQSLAEALKEELDSAQAGLSRIQQEQTDLMAQLESQRLDESLQRHRDRINGQIKAREDLLATLESAVIDEFSGFSPYFIGLARQVPEHVSV